MLELPCVEAAIADELVIRDDLQRHMVRTLEHAEQVELADRLGCHMPDPGQAPVVADDRGEEARQRLGCQAAEDRAPEPAHAPLLC